MSSKRVDPIYHWEVLETLCQHKIYTGIPLLVKHISKTLSRDNVDNVTPRSFRNVPSLNDLATVLNSGRCRVPFHSVQNVTGTVSYRGTLLTTDVWCILFSSNDPSMSCPQARFEGRIEAFHGDRRST
eukprot:3335697-Amphidinium_carterae.1